PGGDPSEGWLGRFARPELWQARAYDARHHDFAWQHRELARLMSNECPLPPDDAVIAAATAAMAEANLYPNSGWELRDALAAFAGVERESVILGNGSTEILDVVTRTFVAPGDEAVIPVPTYAFFETQVRLNGARPILVPVTSELEFDVPAVLAAITPRTKLIFLCSPNNPIGRSWTSDEVEAVLAAGIPTVIDQAYLECGPGRSFAGLVERHPNLIVTRTLSKAFGLAAIRVGYGIADPAVIDLLLRVRIPFSVNLVAIRAALAAVGDPAIVERRRVFISSERDRLFAALAALPGVVPWPSEANFITIDVTATGRTSTDYVDEARADGLLLRRMTAHRLDGEYVRVTIGTREENDRFLDGFARGVALSTGGRDAARA
ncbi:MAG: histidinol-phosphate transaminase, partial [Chloroflexota bacterium]|nr:histidinol-phosphate transaminase [Chloroflexota bacterium]